MTDIYCDHIVDYLNGALTPKETSEFEKHLQSCDECREIIDATGELPYIADPVTPPAGMKARILSNVFEEEDAAPVSDSQPTPPVSATSTVKRRWFSPLIAALLFLSLLGNAYTFWQLNEQEESETQAAFQSVNLQPAETFGGNATAAIVKDGQSLDLVVQAEELEEVTGDQVYQVWLLKDGEPIPAGAFTPGPDGEGTAYYRLNENTEGWDTIAITLEPESGNAVPEGEIVLSSSL